MDAYRAIVTKRDTREFEPDAVRDEDLRSILQAARMAGSAKNEQVNRLVVVTEQAQRDRLAKCGKFSSWVAGAPVVTAFVVPAEGGRPFDYGRMAQNIMITANSLGLGSCPMTFHDEDCTRDVLGLPDDLTAPMGVAVGRPGPPDSSRKSSRRIPLDQLVCWNRWSE
jgi:nitroreductase